MQAPDVFLGGFLLNLIEAAPQVRSGGAAIRFASFRDGQFRLNRLAYPKHSLAAQRHSQQHGSR
jgi:hypothetical protein